jgi:hypothetical protein
VEYEAKIKEQAKEIMSLTEQHDHSILAHTTALQDLKEQLRVHALNSQQQSQQLAQWRASAEIVEREQANIIINLKYVIVNIFRSCCYSSEIVERF